ncbi:MAG TPA: hypothetical protein ENI07_06560 [Desulfobacterales bacterium]|nr:hypothetical protein [Desulfobacterales bacterium]
MKKYSVTIVLILFASHLSAQPTNSFPVYAGLLKIPNYEDSVSGNIEFLALKRIFDIQGIPYQIIINPTEISSFPTIFTAGSLLDSKIDTQIINLLYDYVEGGGVVVSTGQIGKHFYPLFGVTHYTPSRKRYRMHFSGTDQALKYINRPQESTISLGNGEEHLYDEVIWTHGYRVSKGTKPLAVFDDGSVAFCGSRYGRGKTYLLGVTYTDTVLLPQLGKDYEAQRKYVNAFEPSADVIMLILKAIYQAHTKPFIYLSPIPFAKTTALILTHDVDAQTSFVDSLKYADLEKKYGVTSTFFETTKTFVDAMDIDYYNIEDNKIAIKQLKRRGWDIGSHTVSHSRDFADITEGTPLESLKTYHPQNQKTVYGEVIVSKELLDRDIPGQKTISFRAGDLAFPFGLIGILEEAGYLYDSTFSANDVLSAFPFFAFKNRKIGSEVSKVIEIPVTLDDALDFLTEKSLDRAVKKWMEVATANMENEGITVLLVHPSDTRNKNYKLIAQEKLMNHILKVKGWIGNLTAFGEFIRYRNRIKLKVVQDQEKNLIIKTNTQQIHPMVGFVIGNLPKENITVIVKNNEGEDLPYRVIKEKTVFRIVSYQE